MLLFYFSELSYCPSKWICLLTLKCHFPWGHINSFKVKDYGLANGWNTMPRFSFKFTWLPLVSMLAHISWPFKLPFLLNYLFSSFIHCVFCVFHDNLNKFILSHIIVLLLMFCTIFFSVMHLICFHSLCLFKNIQWRAKIILCWVHNDCRFFAQSFCSVELKWPLLVQNKDKTKWKTEENLMDYDEHFSSCNFWKAVGAPCMSLSLSDDVHITR